jgi:hypothetical protein
VNPSFEKNNFLIARNFIESTEAIQLASDFSRYLKLNNCPADGQCVKSPATYNYLGALQVLCDKNAEVGLLIGEKVLPCYCYGRDYRHGDVLERHIDRPSCEISLTVNLDGDTKWPIFIETPDFQTIPVDLNPGDALVYRGTVAPHWREEFTGNRCVQMFFHYVLSEGYNNNNYFDPERRIHQHKRVNSLYR